MVIDFSNYYDFPKQLDRFFGEFSRPYMLNQQRASYPPVNISEDDGNIYVQAEMPGVTMEDVELTLTNKSLAIKGERSSQQGRYFRQERPTGVFQRIVNVNIPINRDAVKATLNDGVLTITLPKAEEMKPRKINIDVA